MVRKGIKVLLFSDVHITSTMSKGAGVSLFKTFLGTLLELLYFLQYGHNL